MILTYVDSIQDADHSIAETSCGDKGNVGSHDGCCMKGYVERLRGSMFQASDKLCWIAGPKFIVGD